MEKMISCEEGYRRVTHVENEYEEDKMQQRLMICVSHKPFLFQALNLNVLKAVLP